MSVLYQVVRSLDGAGKQLQRWILKWVVVLVLIYAVRSHALPYVSLAPIVH